MTILYRLRAPATGQRIVLRVGMAVSGSGESRLAATLEQLRDLGSDTTEHLPVRNARPADPRGNARRRSAAACHVHIKLCLGYVRSLFLFVLNYNLYFNVLPY